MPRNSPEILSRPQRMVTGIMILLIVDLIWVASAELTDFIFNDLDYNKPYFTTYFKTSLFMIYLSGFLFYKPWQRECSQRAILEAVAIRRRYERVRGDDEEVDNDNIEDSSGDENDLDNTNRGMVRSLSSPSWIPANIPDSGKSSGTESDNDSVAKGRRVRFKREAQVVEMNPADALYANLARLSYHASLRAQAALERAASRLTLKEVVELSLVFFLPWFLGNYLYQLALSKTEVAIVNVLSSSSCLFTLILASIFPSETSDRFTLSKFFAICFNTAGIVLVSYSDLNFEGDVPYGAFYTLLGALFYAVYIVLLKRKVNNENNMDSPMFFGFVGMASFAFLWPGLLLIHYLNSETFVIPNSTQWQYMFINGIIGTVLSELLWLLGCFYTSSLVATLAISLNIPLTIMADIIWKGKKYGPIFYIGAVPMFMSFFIVAMLTNYEDWDPILDLVNGVINWFKAIFVPRRRLSRHSGRQDIHENEALIEEQESSQEEL